jgi:hypothetical protein
MWLQTLTLMAPRLTVNVKTSHSKCEKLPRHTKSTSLIGLALDQNTELYVDADYRAQP